MQPTGAELRGVAAMAKRTPFYAPHARLLDRAVAAADLEVLPFTTKEDFRADFTRFLTGEQAIRLHTTSGSTGRPAMVVYSVQEIAAITRRAASTMQLAGVRAGDRMLNLFGYGTFIAGNLYDWGATSLGTLVIPFGSAAMTPPAVAAEAVRTLAPAVVNGVPSYLLRVLGDLARDGCAELERIRILQCAGEVLTPGLRARLAAVAPAAGIFDQYGMTEFGPLAAECSAHDGMHLLEDGLWFEIVDAAGRAVADGEGELAVTTLRNRAMVLLRYRTGDLVTVLSGDCPCGRAGRRIRVRRRADDLTKIRGVLVAKNDLVDAVRAVVGAAPFTIRIHRDDNEVDRLTVTLTAPPGRKTGSTRALAAAVRAELKNRVRVSPDRIALLPALDVPRTISGKPKLVLDEREAALAGGTAPQTLITGLSGPLLPGARHRSGRRARRRAAG